MNVGYILNDDYVICTAVSIYSLLCNSKDLEELNVYIFDDKISKKNKDKLKQLVQESARNIFFIDIENIVSLLKKLDIEPWRGSYTVYVKLMISRFLPETIERFIVLDGDTVIDGSIKELDNMNLDGHPCAMALEGIHSDYKKYAGIGNNEHFNTGVIVYDLPIWKEKQIEKKLVRHLKTVFGKYMLPEEDPISIILINDVKRLEPEYNYLTQFKIFATDKYFRRFKWDRDEKFYKLEDIKKASQQVKIYHCIDTFTNRPWDRNNCHPFCRKYDYYLRKMDVFNINTKVKKTTKLTSQIEYYLRKYLPIQFSIYLYYIAVKIYYTKKAEIYYKVIKNS